MGCLKCGQKLKGSQVFCDDCLAVMAEYPVKPGTPIQLPAHNHTDSAPVRSPKKRFRRPEDQISSLRSSLRWLKVGLLLVTLALLVAVIMLFWLLYGPITFT